MKSFLEIRESLDSAKLSAQDLAEEFLSGVDRVQDETNAFIDVFSRDTILAQAKLSDQRLKSGERNPLIGIPIAVKDNIVIRGERCTAASKILENFVSPYDAHVIERLKKSGAFLVGKCNMDEFAMGSSNENSAFGAVSNPRDLSRVPGGSSGASAAVVASGLLPISLGSDTGGSIRQPASFCGVWGMKTSYGLVSRFGLIAFASSLDQIGPLAVDLEALVASLDSLVDKDPRDSTSVGLGSSDLYSNFVDWKKNDGKLPQKKILYPRKLIEKKVSASVLRSLDSAAEKIEHERGIAVVEGELPFVEHWLSCYYLLCSAEASSNLARYDGIRYGTRLSTFKDKGIEEIYSENRSRGFGDEVKRRILIGTYALSSGYYDAYYKKAAQLRTLLIERMERVFEDVDCVLLPTTPTTAFKKGEKSSGSMEMYESDLFTVLANICGLPALSMPWGEDESKLPLSIQLLGARMADAKLFQIASAMESLKGKPS